MSNFYIVEQIQALSLWMKSEASVIAFGAFTRVWVSCGASGGSFANSRYSCAQSNSY